MSYFGFRSTFPAETSTRSWLILICLLATPFVAAPPASATSEYREIRDANSLAATANDIRNAVGSEFAGAWFANSSSDELVVAVTDAAIERQLALPQDSARRVRIVEAKRSWSYLAASQRMIDMRLSRLIAEQKISTSINPRRNVVAIETTTDLTQAEQEQLDSVIASAAGDAIAENLIPDDQRLAPSAACAFPNCDRPLRGGVRIWGAYGCSAGALAVNGVNKYVLTSGHCGAGAWSAVHKSTNTSRSIGNAVYGYYDFNGDAQRIRATGSFWDIVGWQPGVVSWGYSEFFATWGKGDSYVGMPVCRQGATSGSRCGNVSRVSVTETYTDGTTHSGLIEVPVCTSLGDSGGPYEYNHWIYGLASAGLECPTGNRSVFEPILRAESRLGVTVATAG